MIRAMGCPDVGQLIGARPADQAAAARRPAPAARAADLAISSRACSQDSPMPRCAVSIASATPNPCAHR